MEKITAFVFMYLFSEKGRKSTGEGCIGQWFPSPDLKPPPSLWATRITQSTLEGRSGYIRLHSSLIHLWLNNELIFLINIICVRDWFSFMLQKMQIIMFLMRWSLFSSYTKKSCHMQGWPDSFILLWGTGGLSGSLSLFLKVSLLFLYFQETVRDLPTLHTFQT